MNYLPSVTLIYGETHCEKVWKLKGIPKIQLNATAAFSTQMDKAKANNSWEEVRNLERTTFFSLKPSLLAPPPPYWNHWLMLILSLRITTLQVNNKKLNLHLKTFGQIQTYSIRNAIRNVKCLAFTVPFKSKFLLLPLSLSTFTYAIPP